MKGSLGLFFAIIAVCIAGIILLQVVWLRSYYKVHQQRFREDISASLSDAVKNEEAIAFNKLQDTLYRFVADTANVMVSSSWDSACHSYVYTFVNRTNLGDRITFGDNSLNFPIKAGDDSARLRVIAGYARIYREQALERQSAFFQTRNIQKFIASFNRPLNRASLVSAYQTALKKKGITEAFQLHTGASAPGAVAGSTGVTTEAIVSRLSKEVVTANFGSPFRYLLQKMIGLLIGSVILLAIVGLALFYFLRVTLRQKKLSVIKNDFISNITHELKTPITTVFAAIEAIEYFEKAGDPVKTKKYLTTSKREISRLSELVDKILHVSIYENNDFELRVEPVEIDGLLKEIIQNNEFVKAIDMRYENSSSLTAVKADRLHLFQALNNLVENAAKYGNGKVQINLRASRANGFCVFEVRDNGPGIAKENIPYLFDKFYRVPTGNRHKVKGFGLGLFYVKTIAEKHGGWCKAESTLGTGCSFKIALPYDR